MMRPQLSESSQGIALPNTHSERVALAIPESGATIGKSVKIVGELTGSEHLYIDGQFEGRIHLPGQKVVIGRSALVSAQIEAREIVVLGVVRGNCYATERVDIRSSGSLTGDVVTSRISIEEGAQFQGGIDIRASASDRQVAIEGSTLAAEYDAHAEESIRLGRFETVRDDSELNDILPKWKSHSTFPRPKVAVHSR